jgi:phosphoglycerate dehydrogenase-like enzyme
MTLRVAVLDDYLGVVPGMADWAALDAEVDFFRDHLFDEAAIAARLAPYDVVVCERERTPFPRTLLERLPKLRLLVTTGPVNFFIDLTAARERGIVVCGTGGVATGTPEFILGVIIALARRIAFDHADMRQGGWQTGLGMGLHGRTLGLVGFGRLGGKIAEYGRMLGMKPLAWSRSLTPERAAKGGAHAASLDEVLAEADIVSIHLILGPETRHLIGAREFGLMKKTALFVNTSRGPIVQEAALIDALREKRIAGAAIDVFDVEPLARDHPFRSIDNLMLTPHTGYITEDTYRVFYGDAVENIRAFLAGTPIRVLQPPEIANAAYGR